jgi:hypothetical protein
MCSVRNSESPPLIPRTTNSTLTTLTSRSPSAQDGFSGSRLIAGSVRPLFISRTRATVFRVVPIVELQRLGGATRLQRDLKFQPIALALDEANLKTARGVERGVERRAQLCTISVRTVITSKPSTYEPRTKRLTGFLRILTNFFSTSCF